MVKNLPANSRDVSLIPESGIFTEEGNSSSLQYFCLGKPMEREAWQDTVHGDTKESDMT